MKTWDIQLVDRNGAVPPLGRLVLRYFLLWPVPLLAAALVYATARYTGHGSTDLLIVFTPFVAFLWTWVDKDHQFLQDRVLGTRMIDVRRRPAKPDQAAATAPV